MKQHAHTKKGFTLVESLVAITILISAIVAPLTVAYQGLALTTYAKNQLTAQYLARDAADYITARKDEYELANPNSGNWMTNFASCQSNNGCTIDTENMGAYSSSDISACSSTCPKIKYDSSSGIYSSSAGTATSFTRKIVLQTHSEDSSLKTDEVRALITVTWASSLSANKTFTLRENYYNKINQ